MNHLDFQQAIEYLQKTLPNDKTNLIDQHLLACATCQQEIEVARQFMGTPQNLSAPSPNLLNRVTAAFRRKQERLDNRIEQPPDFAKFHYERSLVSILRRESGPQACSRSGQASLL